MNTLSKLKLTNVARKREETTTEERMRARMLGSLTEQDALAKALINGTTYTVKRTRYEAGEDGERKAVERDKRLRAWFWHDVTGKWYLELRYANSPLMLGENKTSIEVGGKDKLVGTIEAVAEAVKAGELDAAMKEALTKRGKICRKKA